MTSCFHFTQERLRPADDHRGQTGEPCHMHPVGPVGRPVDNLMQKDDLSLPFAHLHRMAGQAFKAGAQVGQLVIMRGKQCAATVAFMQMFQRSPGDGQPVIGGGPAADLVKDDKGPFRGTVQDGGCLDHFHHESGSAARQVIGRTDATEETVNHTNPRAFGRYKQARLRHDGDMCILPQKG